MEQICQCLRLPLEFFTTGRRNYSGAIYWRTQSSATAIARKAAERRIVWLQDIVGYLREHIDFPKTNFPAMDIPADPLQLDSFEIEQIALSLREFWGLSDGPIPSVMTLLENNGVFISRDDLYVPALDGLSRWSMEDNSPFCLIASGKSSAVRTTMDLLHELGHLILHRHLDQRYVSVPMVHKLIEAQAFQFAGAFALPEESFAGDLYSLSLDAFVRLKEKWRVSVSAMIKRCESLELTSEGQIEKLWRSLSAKGWRTDEPLDDQIPIENPHLVARAIELIISEGLVKSDSLPSALALPALDIEDVASLRRGTLGGSEDNLFLLPPPPLFENPTDGPSQDRPKSKVVAFTPRKPSR
jgi:Zn-dependent peptidase ImmA (M78 family)